jgi:chemotaxis family two-component system sensor kinase Cph1
MSLDLSRGAHVCHLFESRDEQREVTLRFIEEGLGRGEYCLHVTSDPSVDDWFNALQASGIDVVTERLRGALEVLPALDWYLATDFGSITHARRLWRTIESKLMHFAGVRRTADMRWTVDNLAADELCHWEATANVVLEDAEVRAICQYDLGYHSPAEIHAALRTHPVVIYDGRPQPNPYYEAPAILANEPFLNASDAESATIEAMLWTFRNTPRK